MTYGFYGAVVALAVFLIGAPFMKGRARLGRDRRRAEDRFARRMSDLDERR